MTIVGDILHSRVARSNMLLLPRLGARVLLCGPRSCCRSMRRESGPGIEIERDFEAAIAPVAGDDDAAHSGGAARRAATGSGRVQGKLPTDRTAAGGAGARGHCDAPGPIIRGLEITAGVADGVQSTILEQVTNGVAIRMAVVERALIAARQGGRA